MKEVQEIEKSPSTEEKIKEAAKRVFFKKGYAATRTRDIAEESGYNLALINYYFRSKEKLFDIIMLEHLQLFAMSVTGIINNRETSLHEKLQILIDHYIDMLSENPDLPMFILREINNDPGKLVEKIGLKERTQDLYIVKQWMEMSQAMNISINPLHIMMNIISMIVFPFIASPLMRNRTGLSMEDFITLMRERKKLIPIWVKAIIAASSQIPNENTQQ